METIAIVLMILYILSILSLDVMFIIALKEKKKNKSCSSNLIKNMKINLLFLFITVILLAGAYSLTNGGTFKQFVMALIGLTFGVFLPPFGVGVVYDLIYILWSNKYIKEQEKH